MYDGSYDPWCSKEGAGGRVLRPPRAAESKGRETIHFKFKTLIFLCSTNFKLLRQIKGNLIKVTFFKVPNFSWGRSLVIARPGSQKTSLRHWLQLRQQIQIRLYTHATSDYETPRHLHIQWCQHKQTVGSASVYGQRKCLSFVSWLIKTT